MDLKYINWHSIALFLLVFWPWPAFVDGGKYYQLINQVIYYQSKMEIHGLKKHGSSFLLYNLTNLLGQFTVYVNGCILLFLLFGAFRLS